MAVKEESEDRKDFVTGSSGKSLEGSDLFHGTRLDREVARKKEHPDIGRIRAKIVVVEGAIFIALLVSLMSLFGALQKSDPGALLQTPEGLTQSVDSMRIQGNSGGG